jgi:hypothetical protein
MDKADVDRGVGAVVPTLAPSGKEGSREFLEGSEFGRCGFGGVGLPLDSCGSDANLCLESCRNRLIVLSALLNQLETRTQTEV